METKTKLKNATQQKRVELIETQKWELIAATATIDNLRQELEDYKEETKTLADTAVVQLREIREEIVSILTDKDSEIKDLTERNGNLTRIVNDQTERIEVMQNELKNYESDVEYFEARNKVRNQILKDYEKEFASIKESRERLASKFTNWFIFLVFIICVELVAIIAMCLRAVNYNLPIF